MELKKKTLIWEENNEPPKNYIWVKSDGKAYEYNNSTRSWELSKTMSSASNGGGNGTDSNASHVYEVSSLEDIQNPKEGDIAIIPDSWGELTIEPTVTEDNGTITKVYNVESYSTNSRIKVTSDPTCFASSYVDSENNSHNSGSVSTNVFPVGTKSITLWETGEFPEVHFYEEVPGATKEYVNGEWVDRTNFSSAIENMSSEEKMQVRKNLGLYYEETTPGEKTAKYTDESESPTLSGYAKISDDTPEKEDIISYYGIEKENLNFSELFEDGYFISGPGVPMGAEMRIVLDNSLGNEPGIYFSIYNIGYAEQAVLVYNGMVDVVSKVPEKFLPKQESGMPTPAVLLSIPTSIANSISGIISDEDYQRLVNLETNVAVYNEESSYLVAVKKWADTYNFQYVDLVFYGKDGVEILICYIDDSFNRTTTVYPIRRSIDGEITDGMTAEQLAEIGVDRTLLQSVLLGYVNFVQYTNGFGGIYAMYSQGDPSDYSTKYVFADLVNIYTINVDFSGTITGATVVAR